VHFCNSPFFVIDTAFYVEPKKPIELRWAYYELLRQDINSMDSGSAIPSTSREDFYSLPVLAPPFAIQQRFVELLTPFWTWQEQNEKESRTLAAIRDALLPKLISGELRVTDAERFLAEARA
jgi:type I restriction enzyme S subunit